jgi:DNA-binding CsgD family transcriptional regulator
MDTMGSGGTITGEVAASADTGKPRLTNRETQVLRLLAKGCTYSRVAERLGMSTHTVGSHVKNSYRKLDVHSAAAAVMRAVELRLFGEVS